MATVFIEKERENDLIVLNGKKEMRNKSITEILTGAFPNEQWEDGDCIVFLEGKLRKVNLNELVKTVIDQMKIN